MHEAYKREKNRVNKLIKHTKANYYIGELSKHKNNPKEMWNTINKLINKNSKTM
jgi:phage terminase large subunit-like protein